MQFVRGVLVVNLCLVGCKSLFDAYGTLDTVQKSSVHDLQLVLVQIIRTVLQWRALYYLPSEPAGVSVTLSRVGLLLVISKRLGQLSGATVGPCLILTWSFPNKT